MSEKRKELRFYGGGYKDIIESGIKLATLRKPNNRYDFAPGEVVTAVCEGEGDVPVTIFRTETRKIIETQLPLLLLDGFTSVDVAVEVMSQFYRGTNRDSEMTLITFTSEQLFESYDLETKELLIGKPQQEAIQMPELRQVFFPSLIWWIGFNEGDLNNWFNFVLDTGLVTRNEYEKWREYASEKIDFAARVFKPESLLKLAEGDRNRATHQNFVLFRNI